MHIYPRRSRLPIDRAGAELGFSTNVIDVTPEFTAELLRYWYSNGNAEKLVARTADNYPVPELLGAFNRFT